MSTNPPDLDEDFLLLKQLADTAACSGYEEPITTKLYDLAKNLCDEVTIDALGSVIATIKGTTGNQTLLIDTHCDEIGFQVILIEKEGFLRIAAVGGQNPRILPGARVQVHCSKGPSIMGVIGEKPIHHLNLEDRKKSSEIKQLFVDIGLPNKEEVEKRIQIGDFITLDQEAIRFTDSTLVTGKAFDDRAGCFLALRLLQRLKENGRIEPNVTVVFAAQEEIGVRGATAAAFGVNPTMAIVLEVGHAMDYPGANKTDTGDNVIGKGPIIPIGPNIHPKLGRKMMGVARSKQIPFQILAIPGTASNDARAIQIVRAGIPSVIMTVPLRYMHTPIEVLDLKDLHHAAELLVAYVLSNPLQ